MPNQRLPYTLVALGLLGVALYPRLAPSLPPVMHTDFAIGAVMGAFLAIEFLGFLMVWKRTRRPQH